MSKAVQSLTEARRNRRLLGHILLVLVIKAGLLFGLWKVWIQPNKVQVDSTMMLEKIAGSAQPAQEKKND